jgi:hypothetical protein
VDERRVIVLVLEVMGPELELAERTARVVMRDVVEIVGMDHRRVNVLVLNVADDTLCRTRLQDAPPTGNELAASAIETKAARRRLSSPRRGTASASRDARPAFKSVSP